MKINRQGHETEPGALRGVRIIPETYRGRSFDLIARRPFELLEKRPFPLGREFENLFETGPELMKPIHLKLYETEEALVARAAMPGFTEKHLNVVAEPCRLVTARKREWNEEGKVDETKELPPHGGNQARRQGCSCGG